MSGASHRLFHQAAGLLRQDPKLRMIDNLRRDMVVAANGAISHWTVEDIFRWPKTRAHPGEGVSEAIGVADTANPLP